MDCIERHELQVRCFGATWEVVMVEDDHDPENNNLPYLDQVKLNGVWLHAIDVLSKYAADGIERAARSLMRKRETA